MRDRAQRSCLVQRGTYVCVDCHAQLGPPSQAIEVIDVPDTCRAARLTCLGDLPAWGHPPLSRRGVILGRELGGMTRHSSLPSASAPVSKRALLWPQAGLRILCCLWGDFIELPISLAWLWYWKGPLIL